jgi:uncharacterized protein (TIGR02996 family)
MTERDALLRAIADDPADHVRQLAFGDWLDEHDEHERAELVRVTVERERWRNEDVNQTRIKNLTARARELESRLSAWPCPTCLAVNPDGLGWRRCPACGGSGDLLRMRENYESPGEAGTRTVTLPLTWRGGYVTGVTVPRLIDAVVEVVRGDGASVCFPTPRLLALCGDTPWGVPIESVMAGDREPEHDHGGGFGWDFVMTGLPARPQDVPVELWRLLKPYRPDEQIDAYGWYDTRHDAIAALSAAIAAYGRAGLPHAASVASVGSAN